MKLLWLSVHFYCAASMQRRLSHERNVCPSIRASVKHVNSEQRKKRADILAPRERPFILVIWQEEQLVGDDPFYLKFWIKLTLCE